MTERRESFLVQDFLEAITAQLDRTQDALRLKSVNRPLTYAVKEFSMDLQVFVELDGGGQVRLRPSASGEQGASMLRIAFTTITRPMVEENTITLAETSSPSLDELGLSGDERKQLERVGVRNAAQLQRLRTSTGTGAVSRYSGVPVDRLRSALLRSKPAVDSVGPAPPAGFEPEPPARQPAPPPEPWQPARPGLQPPFAEAPTGQPPPVAPPTHVAPPFRPRQAVKVAPEQPVKVAPRQPVKVAPGLPRISLPGRGLPLESTFARSTGGEPEPRAQSLELRGRNLLGEDGPPIVRLDGVPLRVVEAEEDRLVVELPAHAGPATLEVALGDGEVLRYRVEHDDDPTGDPWAPLGPHHAGGS